jgi:DNA repair protein RadC
LLKILGVEQTQGDGYIFVLMGMGVQYASIKSWAVDDRPREKLLLKGRAALSDAELISILLSTGSKGLSAVALSQKILELSRNSLNDLGKLSIADFKKIKGVGQAKAIKIVAALELGRRRKEEDLADPIRIQTSKDSYRFFEPFLSDLPHEEFWILLLNGGNKIVGYKRISEGGVNSTIADAKIIFKHAVEHLATSIVLCHNHPSGNIKPSIADIGLTKKLKDAGKLLEISIVDHIIIGDKQYFSFADEDML